MFLRQVLVIAGKDLRAELRTKEALNASVAFALVILLLFSFAFDPSGEQVREMSGGLLWLVFAFARAGRPEEARRLLREYDTVVPAGIRASDQVRWWAVGALAEADHRDTEALAAWRTGYQRTGMCGVCGLFEIAGSMERLGQPDSALMAYERLVTRPSVQSAVQYENFALAPSYKRLGELYEAKGDRKKAADYYGRFVDLYQRADPELQPAVREVRARLGRLAQEPGT